MKTVKVAACQLSEVREDVPRAIAWMETYLAKADSRQVDLVAFPECYLQGYLTDRQTAMSRAISLQSPEFEELLARFSRFHCMFVFGFIEKQNGDLYNSAAVVHRGRLLGCYRKTHLLRGEAIFEPGCEYPIFEVNGLLFGINICYDTNFPGMAAVVAGLGAKLIVCPANNMMPLQLAERMKLLHNKCRAERAKETGCWLISSDVTGARGNHISYGPTAVISPEGKVLAQVPLLQTGMVVAGIDEIR